MGNGKRLFCFGYGYSARALAARIALQGYHIDGTTRDPERATGDEAGIVTLHAYGPGQPLDEQGLAALRLATHVLLSIPPSETGDPVLANYGDTISKLAWIGYLSTTGVYGDHGGARVDETTAPAPTSERGRRRLLAENGWLELWRDRGAPVHIFRLAGIYGPGRSALDSLRTGRARIIDKPGQIFSRIHVDDIANVLMASIDRPHPGAIYNVCDDLPAEPGDVIREAARLLGVEPPKPVKLEDAGLSEMALSFYADNKRVDNRAIHDELGISLLYPDYRSGLAAILAQESEPPGKQ